MASQFVRDVCVRVCFVLLMSLDITFIKQRISRFKFTAFTTHVKSHREEGRKKKQCTKYQHGSWLEDERRPGLYKVSAVNPPTIFVCLFFFGGGGSDCIEKHVESPMFCKKSQCFLQRQSFSVSNTVLKLPGNDERPSLTFFSSLHYRRPALKHIVLKISPLCGHKER